MRYKVTVLLVDIGDGRFDRKNAIEGSSQVAICRRLAGTPCIPRRWLCCTLIERASQVVNGHHAAGSTALSQPAAVGYRDGSLIDLRCVANDVWGLSIA